jgi:hypothetical protein
LVLLLILSSPLNPPILGDFELKKVAISPQIWGAGGARGVLGKMCVHGSLIRGVSARRGNLISFKTHLLRGLVPKSIEHKIQKKTKF